MARSSRFEVEDQFVSFAAGLEVMLLGRASLRSACGACPPYGPGRAASIHYVAGVV